MKSIEAALTILRKPLRVRHLPVRLILEPTTKCNLNCQMCPRSDFVEHAKDMTLTDFKKICSILKPKKLSLAGLGEPLMNPDLMEMIRHAKKQGLSIDISSNLTLLTPDLAERIVQSGLDIVKVSVDSATRETYQKIRGQDHFQKVLDGVKILSDVKKKLKSITPFIRFQFVLQRDNFLEVTALIALSKKLSVEEVSLAPLHFLYVKEERKRKRKEELIGDLRSDLVLEELMRAKTLSQKLKVNTNLPVLIKEFSLYWGEYYAEKFKRMSNRICFEPWLSVYVHVDGTITPCCSTDHPKYYDMGNILRDDFQNIWNGKRYQELRKAMRKGKGSLKMCDTCVPRSFPSYLKLTNILPSLFNTYLKLGFPFGKPKL